MLMGTSVSAFEQPLLAKGGGVCTDQRMDYSPLAQPCANDFAKGGMYSKDNTVSRMEVRRPSSPVPRAGKRRTAACPACPRRRTRAVRGHRGAQRAALHSERGIVVSDRSDKKKLLANLDVHARRDARSGGG